MKTTYFTRAAIAAAALSLSLSGCLSLNEQSEGEAEISSQQYTDAGLWVLNEVGSFVFGEAFGLLIPSDDAVDLSDETLEKIAQIVNQSVRSEWFIQYDSQSKTIYDLADEYYRSDCTNDPRCDDRFIEDHIDEADRIAYNALLLLNSYDNPSYREQRLQVAQHIQNIAPIRLAFLQEIYQLHAIDDNPADDLLHERWNICDNADEYDDLLADMEQQFEDSFSQPYMKKVSQRNNPGGVILPGSVDREYKGCFSGMGREICGDKIRDYHQASTGIVTWSGESEQALLDEAAALRQDTREEIFGSNLAAVRSEMQRIAACEVALAPGTLFLDEAGAPQSCMDAPDVNFNLLSNSDGDKTHTLVWQNDGNLVLYKSGSGAVWHTNTAPNRDARLCLQDNGNLVVSRGNSVLWNAGADGRGETLNLSESGALNIRGDAGQIIWQR